MTELDDAHISVRFKHGIHTIYLFVDALAPMSEVTTELINVITERYPQGLTTRIEPPKNTPVDENSKIVFGALKIPNDLSSGWTKLKTGNGEHSPTKLGLKNNSLIAFAVVRHEDDNPDFEIEWPREDEDIYEE
ncbi:hypothetical protein NW768_011343 [Fusarium equiseti]|uniref:Uncharacterized protein n=1 Tax=Fusarium equiseti TaxID=61235 RepID=A0ABQ8QXY0_FUSEQ|nr:hypothetical protein NW768_011343 [Fusarium equiseti]